MIKGLGMLCNKEQMAVDLIDEIQEGFAEIKQVSKRVLYFIWKFRLNFYICACCLEKVANQFSYF